MDSPVYTVRITPEAEHDLEKVQKHGKARTAEKIKSLALDPRPHGVKKIQGMKNLYRIRVGDYRVVYQIRDKVLLVLVVRIARRKDVYRNL